MSADPTLLTFTGDGTTQLYSFQFDYLRKEFVKVRVNGEDVPFVFNNDKTVQLINIAPVGSLITVSRETDTGRLVTFVDGSVLLADDLNAADVQVMHVLQEEKDRNSVAFQFADDGTITLGDRSIQVTPAQSLFLLQQIGNVSDSSLSFLHPEDISDFTSALDAALNA